MSRASWLICLAGLLLACGASTLFFLCAHRPSRGLPYRDSFANGKAEEWHALGGTWQLADGSMRNDSDERGAKLLTGSSQWSDYSIEADLMLLGKDGDAGLLVRSSDEEEGVDAYTGYYAGIRTGDNTLVLGRAGYAWTEVTQPVNSDPGGVRALRWYHLKLLTYACQIAAAVNGQQENQKTTIAVQDPQCLTKGRAGLRSYASGGIWRNVVIRRATREDLDAMLASAGRSPQPARTAAPSPVPAFALLHPDADMWKGMKSSSHAQSISSLRLLPPSPSMTATIRGAVVLASPALFIQDATGGVAVQGAATQPLKVGDEVEVTGSLRNNAFSPTLERANVEVLWENTPMPPLSVTASQAATGVFDSTFVEVEGLLRGKQRGLNDSLILSLDEGPQSFRAVLNRGRGDTLYTSLKPGSRLRLRGIAVADSAYTHDLVPFVLLLRSSDDVAVLAGPPWWNGRHVALLAAVFLFCGMAGNHIYHRVQSWRLRAVIEEREHIAYEMHDSLSQSFAGIGFQLKAIREGMPKEYPWLQQQLDLASELVRQSHKETRRSIAVLRPDQSVSDDLMKALQECANRLVEGGSVQIVGNCVGTPIKASLRITDTLYHIGQEALANAVQHAHPSTLRILLVYESKEVELCIEDDGCGFASDATLPGFGLQSMRKRAASIGAELHIRSHPGKGTAISVRSRLKSGRTYHGA
jgi:hypothetical protein